MSQNYRSYHEDIESTGEEIRLIKEFLMLGILRFFLASCVIAFHLSVKIPGIGLYAVNFFYVISGYLITLILNKSYQFHFGRFSLNRFLRLYPTYFFFLLIGALIIYSFPDAKGFHGSWTLDYQPYDKIANILIFPWAFLSDSAVPFFFSAFTDKTVLFSDVNRFRIVTSSWSVAVEIVCYFILWAFAARSRATALLTFGLACAYHAYVIVFLNNVGATYYPFIAAMLPFSIGALGFYISDYIESRGFTFAKTNFSQALWTGGIVVAFLINWYFSTHPDNVWQSFYYYANDIIALIAMITLHGAVLSPKYKSIGRWLGDLSYPIFLGHYFGAFFAWKILGGDTRGWDIFLLGYVFTIILGVISVLLIDRRVSSIRDMIRPSNIKRP